MFFAAHTKQLMTEDQYIKISGRWQQTLLDEFGLGEAVKNKGRMKVSPFDLLVNYDVKVRDGSIPGGNFSGVWTQMFETIAKNPELAQKFDLTRIFMHIARNNGAKNVQEFIKTKVMPDEVVQDQAQKGNLVPFNPAGGAAGGI